jgi:hypothetical protein
MISFIYFRSKTFNILVNQRNATKTFFMKIYFYVQTKNNCLLTFTSMFAWNAFILTKQTITSCSITEKFRKVNIPSHDRVCDYRIRHLNHLQSSIVLSTKVNNLPFWKFECSQERRCHGSVKMTVSDRWVWFRLEWLTRQLQTTLMCLE